MINAEIIQKRAKQRRERLRNARRDPRYRQVLGRLVAAGALGTTEGIPPYKAPVKISDALWAGQVEPRILELLPALIVKRPSLFIRGEPLPDDLRDAVAALRKNLIPNDFRGIPGPALQRWVPLVGHRNKLPSRLKAFRLQAQDHALLDKISKTLGLSHTDVVRRALNELAAQILLG
jgi:hypothetical protein